jgi:hypothetical protein
MQTTKPHKCEYQRHYEQTEYFMLILAFVFFIDVLLLLVETFKILGL